MEYYCSVCNHTSIKESFIFLKGTFICQNSLECKQRKDLLDIEKNKKLELKRIKDKHNKKLWETVNIEEQFFKRFDIDISKIQQLEPNFYYDKTQMTFYMNNNGYLEIPDINIQLRLSKQHFGTNSDIYNFLTTKESKCFLCNMSNNNKCMNRIYLDYFDATVYQCKIKCI